MLGAAADDADAVVVGQHRLDAGDVDLVQRLPAQAHRHQDDHRAEPLLRPAVRPLRPLLLLGILLVLVLVLVLVVVVVVVDIGRRWRLDGLGVGDGAAAQLRVGASVAAQGLQQVL